MTQALAVACSESCLHSKSSRAWITSRGMTMEVSMHIATRSGTGWVFLYLHAYSMFCRSTTPNKSGTATTTWSTIASRRIWLRWIHPTLSPTHMWEWFWNENIIKIARKALVQKWIKYSRSFATYFFITVVTYCLVFEKIPQSMQNALHNLWYDHFYHQIFG